MCAGPSSQLFVPLRTPPHAGRTIPFGLEVPIDMINHQNRPSRFLQLSKMRLATKLSLLIGSVLAVIFVILIALVLVTTRSAIESRTYGELLSIAEHNGTQIQHVFDTAENTALGIQSYLEECYVKTDNDPQSARVPTDPEAKALCMSIIYTGTPLSATMYDAEQFLTATARYTALNNDDIVNVGVMFEPYAFQSTIRDYSFLVQHDTANEKIYPFGAYETYSGEDYYKQAATARQSIVTSPYYYQGDLLMSYSSPIIHDNVLKGVVMADIDVNRFNKIDAANENYPSMWATIYDSTGTIVYDSQSLDNIHVNISEFTPNADDLTYIQDSMSKGEAFTVVMKRETGESVTCFYSPISVANQTWWSMTALNTVDIQRTTTQTTLLLFLVCILALIVIVVVIIFVLKRLHRPINDIVAAAQSIVAGDLDIKLQVHSEDEIGQLSRAFLQMTENLKAIIVDVDYCLNELGNGNFCVKSRERDRYVGEYQEIYVAMHRIMATLSQTLYRINGAAEQVASSSELVSNGSVALSQGATEQASSIEELAATINDISAHVKRNAENAQSVSQKVVAVNQQMTESNQMMQNTVSAMNEIRDSSSEIGKIIKTIEDIAFQTNILALNAAIEAARAGAAGRGFAVVADEVRNLAGKTADASKETTALIERSLQSIEQGTSSMDATARSLEKVVEGARTITDSIQQISSASDEQASSISQITAGIDQISSVIQTNSATAQEGAAASEELTAQSQILKNLILHFELDESVISDMDVDNTQPSLSYKAPSANIAPDAPTSTPTSAPTSDTANFDSFGGFDAKY